jgi:DoxX-like family
MTTKGKNISYWTTTGLIAFFIGSGGAAQIAQYLGNPHGVVPVLGYPMYFFAILGFWKVLGAIAILVPR